MKRPDHKIFLLFITSLLLFISCNQENKIDEEFYITVANSQLYVRLIGNKSKPLIINLHGGPGGFSSFDHIFNKNHLEKDYLIAYLDQRGGGKSKTFTDTTMLNMPQFVEDLDVVVDSLQHRFEDKKINLIGSSWGGTLGLLYMIEHQDKINSFACVSGKADGIYPIKAIINHERKLALNFLNNSNDSITNKRYHEIVEKLTEIEESNLNYFFDDMNLIKHEFPKELGFNAYWKNTEALKLAEELGKDSTYFADAGYTKEEFDLAMDKFEYVNRVFRNSSDYNRMNIINDLQVINKPILVMQGKEDYVIGKKQAEMIYAALKGIPENKKELKIIPNAAHNLNLEAEKDYYDTVKSFFDKHNK